MRYLITGGTGLVGSNLTEALRARGDDVVSVGSRDCDLVDFQATRSLFAEVRPTSVIHLAAKVGGIHANSTRKADFYEVNTLINTHVVMAAREAGVARLHAMGTGCAYPKRLENQDLVEDLFLEGRPEPTNDAYAYAKRNLLVHLAACQEQHGMDYTYLVPANLFGPHDNFHPMDSHVVPALLRKFMSAAHEDAPSVKVWGTGRAERDFLYIGDCVDAILTVLDDDAATGCFNVATGMRTTIATLASEIAGVTGFGGAVEFDTGFPEGQATRIMNIERIARLGWTARVSLREGLRRTVEWCKNHPETWRTPVSSSPA